MTEERSRAWVRCLHRTALILVAGLAFLLFGFVPDFFGGVATTRRLQRPDRESFGLNPGSFQRAFDEVRCDSSFRNLRDTVAHHIALDLDQAAGPRPRAEVLIVPCTSHTWRDGGAACETAARTLLRAATETREVARLAA